MNVLKKTSLGLSLFLAVLVWVFVSAPPAQAASKSDVQACLGSLQFTDIAHILCNTSSGTASFLDNNPTDHDDIYDSKGTFCSPSGGNSVDIYSNSNNFKIGDAGSDQNFDTSGIGYADAANQCLSYNSSNVNISGSNTGGIFNLLQFTSNGDNITSLSGVSHGSLSGQSYSVLNGDPGSGYYYVSGDFDVKGASCKGSLIAVSLGPGSSNSDKTTATGIKYQFKSGADGGDLTQFLQDNGNTGGCGIDSHVGFGLGDENGFGIIGTPPNSVKNGGGGAGGGGAGSGGGTCESNSHIGIEWIFCPLIKGIDHVVVLFYGEVENQLCFPDGPSSTEGGVTCNGNNNLTPQVHQAWALMKNITTAILVLIMLIMVVSQAFGEGVFDAYTVRKVLPKLVAAAILMQLSWIIAKWAIDLSNDVGRGIKAILYAPFPPGTFSIDTALKNIGSVGVASTAAIFAAIAATVLFSGLTVFGMLIIALSGLAALFVGFLVLLFRKVLIILSVIFFPVALAAWILPGTERFWKLWRDNFGKLLVMFPLIVALITAGRIFGTVAGGTTHSFVALLSVLVGFFGPLFVLPKTYQWGGNALGSLSGAIVNGTKAYRRRPAQYAMNIGKENRQFRATERSRRIARDPNAASYWDRALAGRYNLARGSNILGGRAARVRTYSNAVAEGQEAGRKAVAQELLTHGYENWDHPKKLEALESWLRGESYGGINAEGNDELRLFAFKSLADLGDQDRIRKARHEGKLKGSVWLKGRAENISSLNQQASDMGIQNNLSEVAPDAMASWKSHTFKEWIRQVQQGVVMDNSDEGGGDTRLQGAARQKQLDNAQRQAQRLMDNRLVFDRLSVDQQELVRRMATREGTRVSVSDAGVTLSRGENLAARASVREDMIVNLSQGTRAAQAVASNLAGQVVQANLNPGSVNPQDQAGLEQVIESIRDQATTINAAGQRVQNPNATPQMRQAFSNIQQALDESLGQHVAEAERRLTAGNSPNVGAAVAAEQARAAAVKTRLGI